MTEEQYKQKLKKLDDEINKIKKQYIIENCQFKVGDKVRLHDKYGIIKSIEVNDFGSFYGSWQQIKKDGTPYSYLTNYYIHDYDFMQLVKNDK